MIRGDAEALVEGVSPEDVFDFVLDPAQYTKADTKMRWVTKLADTPDGMIAREDGTFLGRFPGSVVTRYRWEQPERIDVRLEHGVPKHLHAWFDIRQRDGGTWFRHVEEMDFGRGPLGWLFALVARRWFADAVTQEVAEIKRLLEAGERGRGLEAL
ncbi:MAG: SRPBCC family protein [Acidimicrobiales bacterium]